LGSVGGFCLILPFIYNIISQMATQRPPLAGRPPFATDEPDSTYQDPTPQRRLRQKPPTDPNSRSSAYDVYDNYLDNTNRHSGVGALGMGLLNGNMSDDDDDDNDDDQHRMPTPRNNAPPVAVATHPQTQHAIPLAAPRPGYAAPISALNLSRPAPTAIPNGRQPAPPQAQKFHSPSPVSVPSTPHPLQPPMTPITPVFARPAKSPALSRDIMFTPEPIMRGNSEDALIPKRGEKGDDFWRRFSMVAHVESNHKESTWLRKTRNGSSRLSRWVWFISVCLLLCIAGAIFLGWYASHNKPSHQQPTPFGGGANESAASSTATGISGTASFQAKGASTSPHVSPTNTVARRAVYSDPVPTSPTLLQRNEPGNERTSRRQHANRMLHH